MTLGIIILFIGILFLLNNLGVIVLTASIWNILWPCILIAIGLSLAFGHRCRFCRWQRWGGRWEEKMKRKFGDDNNPE